MMDNRTREEIQEEINVEQVNQYVMNDIPIRLLRISDSGAFEFVDRSEVRKHFKGSVPNHTSIDAPTIVKYAILSHRWLDEGEPTYDDMMDKNRRNKTGPGFEKLRRFCQKAKEYDIEFAWSDTCCINKSSSTELDESIRSMFRWYRNSTMCFIHLAQSETIPDIMRDDWMKRGWTLQELLAPYRIKLFNLRWEPMTRDENDKSSKDTEVMRALERATCIPSHALRELSPGPFSVDERMTWAAKRKTTRAEDVAYSLMGIFAVSLQIAYGEGGDRAFCRLVEAIMQAGDRSVLNWRGDAAVHHSSGAIPQSPHSYVGRTLDLNLDLVLSPLEMTMTSLGLRVPLVIFPLRIVPTNTPGRPENPIVAECTLCPVIRVNLPNMLRNAETGRDLALGIVNYSLQMGCREPAVRGESICFVLQRDRTEILLSSDMPVVPNPKDFVGLRMASSPKYWRTGWKKAHKEGLVKVKFPNIPRDKCFYVSSDYLEIVYL